MPQFGFHMPRFSFLIKSVLVFLFFAFSMEIWGAEEKNTVQPITVEGVENLYRVNANLYRSGQPNSQAMQALEKMGIKAILNLRQYHSDKNEAEGTGLILQHIKMNAGEIKDEDIVRALRIILESSGPVLVHCWHGSDRTGTVIAMYRLVVQRWDKKDALAELSEEKYGHHEKWYPNIRQYINDVDVEKIRKEVMSASDDAPKK